MTEQPLSTVIANEETKKIESVLEKFNSAASVEAVYGKPVKQGDIVVIPAAEVMSFMGFGIGSGSGMDPATQAGGGGGGGGGGGRVLARPAAVIVIENGQVRVEPVVDVTKIALGMFTAVGFVAGMMWRMSRGRLRV
jgi:uncharacterized spore protein YtfJ